VCCIYFGAFVCELRTRKNSRVLDIADCVSFERVDYLTHQDKLSCMYCEWIVLCFGVVSPLWRTSGMRCVDCVIYCRRCVCQHVTSDLIVTEVTALVLCYFRADDV